MKTELKTLKDLERMGKNSFPDNSVIILKEDLRAEAVKWVKEKNFRIEDGWDCFITFLNLTEEDLK